MKRGLFIAILMFANILAQAQSGHQIKGTISGIADTTCILAYYYSDKQFARDTAFIDSKGQFIFSGDEELDGGIYMIVFPDGNYFELLVSEQIFSLTTDINNLISEMSFNNSNENTLFYEYLKFVSEKGADLQEQQKLLDAADEKDKIGIEGIIFAINEEVADYRKSFTKKHPNAFVSKIISASTEIQVPEAPLLSNGKIDSTFQFKYYKKHFFDNIDFSDSRMLRTPIFQNKINTYLEKLTVKHPDSIISSIDFLVEKSRVNDNVFKYVVSSITSKYERSKIMGMEKVFVDMVEKYYMTNQTWWIDEAQMFKITDRAETIKPLMVGQVAPEVILKDTLGRRHSLHNTNSDFTLLLFWDPDCGHCKKEMPKIKEQYDLLKKDGINVAVYAICTEIDIEKWKEYINEQELFDWVHVCDPHLGEDKEVTYWFRTLYDINATPKTYILDKEKKILVNAIKGSIPVDKIAEIIKRENQKD